jgi:hypothetical protein
MIILMTEGSLLGSELRALEIYSAAAGDCRATRLTNLLLSAHKFSMLAKSPITRRFLSLVVSLTSQPHPT